MNNRLEKIMKSVEMNQRDFAAAIGVSASTLNSMLKGHTSVTNTTVQAIHRRFPEINISWLMFDEGDMQTNEQQRSTTVGGNQPAPPSPQDSTPNPPAEDLLLFSDGMGGSHFETANKEVNSAGQVIIREVKYIDKPQRSITEIRVFYDDGTFDTFPGKRD